uniref:Low temperature and salt responsive protein n=1 Tax=Kryptoperidinium triquetrum TaxID=66468 RepID=A8I1P4_KRYTR|nr:low temperature and salt responsive protein [Heterocapsa triquetra]
MCGKGACNCAVSSVCAYVVPPLGVYWRFGCGMEFFICLILTMLGFVPGLVYACVMIGCEAPMRGIDFEDNAADGAVPADVVGAKVAQIEMV